MTFSRRFLSAVVALFAMAAPARAQSPAAVDTTRDDLPRVFLDCQANGCDGDFLRTELTWLNFVRDRTLASVHILATSQSTASGGTELTVAFIGLGGNAARVDTIIQASPPSDTFDERRRLLRRVISQGMMRFVANTALAPRLAITYRAPEAGAPASGTRGASDRWNLWVFRVSGNAHGSGEESQSFKSTNGSFRASRITAQFKTVLELNGNYSESRYTLSDGEAYNTYRHGYSSQALFVRSLNEHWSLGLQANASSSVTSNLRLGTRVGPAVEYDLFPYSESTRRQVILRYSLGIKSLVYDSITVYDKTRETLPDHRLIVAAEATQPWGGIGGSLTASQYLNSPGKYRLDGSMGVSWRIVRGLNLNFDLGYTKLRDQINLRRGSASDDEILLQLRQLRTGYYYYGSVGISYTFGSVFQNVVNPRFTRNTGGFFF